MKKNIKSIKRKKTTSRYPVSIGSILRNEQKELCKYQPIWENWEDAVGADIARRAEPDSVAKSGILTVNVTSSVWMQELHFIKQTLIDALNEKCGGFLVKDIQFRHKNINITPHATKQILRAAHSAPPPVIEKKHRKELSTSLDSLRDSELKRIIAKLLDTIEK